MTKIRTKVNVTGKAELTCEVPSYWDSLGEDEKIEYVLKNCTMVMDMEQLNILDDEGLSAQDLVEEIDFYEQEEKYKSRLN
jgi:hypothetical protein